jgi:fimbrial isopeptide formation D2 family protein/uncharacterized repeat protein (TIGR01451 family)
LLLALLLLGALAGLVCHATPSHAAVNPYQDVTVDQSWMGQSSGLSFDQNAARLDESRSWASFPNADEELHIGRDIWGKEAEGQYTVRLPVPLGRRNDPATVTSNATGQHMLDGGEITIVYALQGTTYHGHPIDMTVHVTNLRDCYYLQRENNNPYLFNKSAVDWDDPGRGIGYVFSFTPLSTSSSRLEGVQSADIEVTFAYSDGHSDTAADGSVVPDHLIDMDDADYLWCTAGQLDQDYLGVEGVQILDNAWQGYLSTATSMVRGDVTSASGYQLNTARDLRDDGRTWSPTLLGSPYSDTPVAPTYYGTTPDMRIQPADRGVLDGYVGNTNKSEGAPFESYYRAMVAAGYSSWIDAGVSWSTEPGSWARTKFTVLDQVGSIGWPMSFAPITAEEPTAPTKTVDKVEAWQGDVLTYEVTQRINQAGVDCANNYHYTSWVFSDTLPVGVTPTALRVEWEDAEGTRHDATAEQGTTAIDGQTVTYTFDAAALDRMVLNGSDYHFVISAVIDNGTAGGTVLTNTASNTFNSRYTIETNPVSTAVIPTYGVSVTKQDDTTGTTAQGDATLEGVTFDVINSSGRAVTTRGGATYADGATITSVTTDGSGLAATAPTLLPSGTYTLRESGTNRSLLVGRDVSRTVEVPSGTADGTVVAARTAVCDPVVRGGISVRKVDVETGEARPLGSASLAGAEFTLTNSSQGAVMVDGTTHAVGDVVCVLVTDEDGLCQTGPTDLPYGTYTVTETKAPTGYELASAWEQVVQVREQGVVVPCQTDCADQVFRADMTFSKTLLDEAAGTQEPLRGGAFLVTSRTTGESHVVVLDENGTYDSAEHPHSELTNANDAAMSVGDDGIRQVDESELDPDAGTWFFGHAPEGRPDVGATPDDAVGALPYDTYEIRELRTSGNAGYQLVSFTFECHKDRALTDLGTKVDLRQASPGKAYDTNNTLGVDGPVTDASAVGAGDRICYRLCAANTSGDAASMTFTDTLSRGLAYDGNAVAYDADGKERAIDSMDARPHDDGTTTLTIRFDGVAANGVVSVHYTATVAADATGQVDNDASVTIGAETDIRLDRLTNPVATPQVHLDKQLASIDLDAGTASYDITVTAEGADVAAGYRIADTFDNLELSGFTATDADGEDITGDVALDDGVLTMPGLAADSPVTLHVSFAIIDTGMQIRNHVFPKDPDQSYELDKVRCDEDGTALAADQAPTVVGDAVHYLVSVTNTGNEALPSLTVRDVTSKNMTLLAASEGKLTNGILTWDTGELDPGATASTIVSATVDSAGDGTCTNTASSPDHAVVVTDPLADPPADTSPAPGDPGPSDAPGGGTMPGTGLGIAPYALAVGGAAVVTASVVGLLRRKRRADSRGHEIG